MKIRPCWFFPLFFFILPLIILLFSHFMTCCVLTPTPLSRVLEVEVSGVLMSSSSPDTHPQLEHDYLMDHYSTCSLSCEQRQRSETVQLVLFLSQFIFQFLFLCYAGAMLVLVLFLALCAVRRRLKFIIVYLVSLVYLVCLVSLVCLVYVEQTSK
jgi:hypothetical protein